MHIAIQGGPFSFHELAAKQYLASPLTFEYCKTFQEVFDAIKTSKVDRGFIATSNSAHGPINEVSKLFEINLPIIEETYHYKVRQHLIGTADSTVMSITKVVSHPVALSQCSAYLRSYHLEEYHDTAEAIRYVKELNNPGIAAVGSLAAANHYGLKILKSDIHNDPDNYTIFVLFQ